MRRRPIAAYMKTFQHKEARDDLASDATAASAVESLHGEARVLSHSDVVPQTATTDSCEGFSNIVRVSVFRSCCCAP